jgi:hypothetical protein
MPGILAQKLSEAHVRIVVNVITKDLPMDQLWQLTVVASSLISIM